MTPTTEALAEWLDEEADKMETMRIIQRGEEAQLTPRGKFYKAAARLRALEAENERLRKALRGLLVLSETNECTHEETHRGGAIWTICNACGMEWADDRGGFQPYVEPSEITEARVALEDEHAHS